MQNKAIFLDRDGTINVEKHYLYKIEHFEFLPGVLEGLKLLQDAGFLLIIITNQSGIARGYYTEEDFNVLNDWMLKTLRKQGIEISKVYYCPHLPDAKIEKYRKDCACRKPELGMFQRAIEEFSLDIGQCYAIGDKLRDCEICKQTACKGYIIGNESAGAITESVEGHQNINYASDLYECAVRIVSNS